MDQATHSRDLSDYGALLHRHWVIVSLFLIAGVAGAVAALLATPPEYVATAQVQVLPTGMRDQGNQITSRQREPLNLDTEAQIAQSSVVADKAAQLLKNPDPEGLRKRVGIDVPPNSAILSISFSAPDSPGAAAGAQAFADAYLKNRAEAATHALDDDLKALRGRLREVNAGLVKAAAGVAALQKGTAERAVAAHQQSVLARQGYSLTLKYDGLRTIAVTPGIVISRARPPAQPDAPSVPIYLGGGLFAGLVLGAGAALARDRRR
ncbi:hypothetical protein J5X84_32205 [Streptosporangiaceae bacterium NEAU-GS5]|nr:hypothetical protein [Streptosporangiaceae bacterium NEAU-GS5]